MRSLDELAGWGLQFAAGFLTEYRLDAFMRTVIGVTEDDGEIVLAEAPGFPQDVFSAICKVALVAHGCQAYVMVSETWGRVTDPEDADLEGDLAEDPDRFESLTAVASDGRNAVIETAKILRSGKAFAGLDGLQVGRTPAAGGSMADLLPRDRPSPAAVQRAREILAENACMIHPIAPRGAVK